MNDKEILEILNEYSEDDMIEEIIVPLYKMKFNNKFFDIEFSGKDKKEDQGIDITYFEISPDTGSKEYYGIQVKQNDINTGKGPNGIASIMLQAQQAFSKPIVNIKDKATYHIKTYIILTTGNVNAPAHQQIVDQFKDKNIRFIIGTDISSWIKSHYWKEFSELIDTENDDQVENEMEPIDLILDFIYEKHEDLIKELETSFDVLSKNQAKIVKYLLLQGDSKSFGIARYLHKSLNNIQTDLDELINQGIIDFEEGDYFLDSDEFDNWVIIEETALNRIDKLGYSNDIKIDEIFESLFDI